MKRFALFTLILHLLCLFFGIVPKGKAGIIYPSYVTEITSNLPAGCEIDDVEKDSQHRVYISDDAGKLYRSDNLGETWTENLVCGYSGIYTLFVDSRDRIYFYGIASGITYLKYSDDYGSTWNTAFSGFGEYLRIFTEDSTGRIYAVNYDTSAPRMAYIYRSNTTGLDWTLWANLTVEDGEGSHIHYVNIAPNGYIYVAMGDIQYGEHTGSIRRYNGVDWEIVVESDVHNETETQRDTQPSSIFFLDDYVYFLPDEFFWIMRMPITGTWNQREWVYNLATFGASVAEKNVVIDGMVFFGDWQGVFAASWDGEHYVKLIDDTSLGWFRHGAVQSQNSFPLFVCAEDVGKVFRIDRITKEDLVQMYYSFVNTKRGSITNADTYILEQRLHNGTNYADLTNVALSNVQASIKGLNRTDNVIANSGFETGGLTGWNVYYGSPRFTVIGTDKREGSYCGQANTTGGSIQLQQAGIMARNSPLVLNFCIKGNEYIASGMSFSLINNTGTASVFWSYPINVANYWVNKTYVSPSFNDNDALTPVIYRWTFITTNKLMYLDAVHLFQQEVSYINDAATSTSVQYTKAGEIQNSYTVSTTSLQTLDPSLTINGQAVSHSGYLNNGTESTSANLTGIFTGAVQVTATISGSEQAILKLNGTRIVYEDSIVLQTYVNDTGFAGRYYGTFSPTTMTTDFIAVCNLASNITFFSFSSTNLKIKISSQINSTSTIFIYHSSIGNATSVLGTMSWSYSNSTKIFTITKNHTVQEHEINLFWQPSGTFTAGNRISIFFSP